MIGDSGAYYPLESNFSQSSTSVFDYCNDLVDLDISTVEIMLIIMTLCDTHWKFYWNI